MFRSLVRRSVIALVAAVGLVLAPLGLSAALAVTPVGAVSVQLTEQGGAPRAVAGVTITLEWAGQVLRTATTNSAGTATIQNVQAKPGYTVLTAQQPAAGPDTLAPGAAYRINVDEGVTTKVPVVMQHGASISGRVIGPNGADAGVGVDAFGQRSGDIVKVIADANGHYELDGLPTDVWEIAIYPSPDAMPTEFHVNATAQNGTTPAQHLSLAPAYAHSTYDIVVEANGDSTVSFNGATIRVWDPSTGVQGTQVGDSSTSPEKLGEFELPSGVYNASVTTVATASAPSVTYYYTGTDGVMTTNPAAAGGREVDFGTLAFLFATVSA